MTTSITQVKDLTIGDSVLDHDNLELEIKAIEKIGGFFHVTVNYKESEFYGCSDTVKKMKGATNVNRLHAAG